MTTIRPRIHRSLLTLPIAVVMLSACLALLAIGASANARPYVATTASATAKTSKALSAAARARTLADYALTSAARRLKRCLRTPHTRCREARRAVGRSGIRLARADRHLSKLAQGRPGAGRRNVDDSAWAPKVTILLPPATTAPTPAPPVTIPSVTTPLPGSESGNAGAPLEMALVPGSLAGTEPGTVRQLGAHSVRMGYPIETPASQLAGVMEEYAKVGIRIMLLATFTGKVPTSAQAANLASWAAAYGPGGTFWRGKPFPADTAMTDIEFGNETSYTYQFSDNSEEAIAARAQSYALRFKEAEESIHAVAPNVGLLAQGDNGETDGSTWVDNMFKAVPNLAQLVAGWTIHPYGAEPVRRIDELIAQTQAAGALSTIPIYVTEWGLSTDGGRCLSENYGWNPCMSYEEAATDLATSVATMHEHFGGRLRAVYLYQAQDLASSGSSTDREEYFGALQQNGARKGAYTTEVEALLHTNP